MATPGIGLHRLDLRDDIVHLGKQCAQVQVLGRHGPSGHQADLPLGKSGKGATDRPDQSRFVFINQKTSRTQRLGDPQSINVGLGEHHRVSGHRGEAEGTPPLLRDLQGNTCTLSNFDAGQVGLLAE